MKLDDNMMRVLDKSVREMTTVYFSGDALPITFQSKIVSLDSKMITLENVVPLEYIKDFCRSVSFELKVSMFSLRGDKILACGNHIRLPVAEAQPIENKRKEERFYFNDNETVIACLLNPHDKMTINKKRVIEMSASGLSFRSDVDSELFQAGKRFEDVKVYINQDLYKHFHMEVVYKRKMLSLEGRRAYQIGCQIVS